MEGKKVGEMVFISVCNFVALNGTYKLFDEHLLFSVIKYPFKMSS